jgi:hypothetical protein
LFLEKLKRFSLYTKRLTIPGEILGGTSGGAPRKL